MCEDEFVKRLQMDRKLPVEYYVAFLNRPNVLEVKSEKCNFFIEFLIMKMHVKYFEWKYLQFKPIQPH